MNWRKRLLEQARERGISVAQVEELLEEWEMEYMEPPRDLDDLIMGVLE